MRIAIIDIGSNAIRAVIYNENYIGSCEIYNEKFKCDLSSLLDLDDIDVKHHSYSILGYFSHIFKKFEVEKIEAVATEVVRKSINAHKFVEIVKDKFGIEVKILPGEEEAFLTASGLILGIADANGIAADLGGGSLEIAKISDKQVLEVKSLPLGTKILSKQHIESTDYIIKTIQQAFIQEKSKNLYLIGGALRLVGRCYMDYSYNKVRNLHNLVLDPKIFLDFLDQLENLQKFHKLSKRYKVNTHGITVLKALIEVFEPENLVFSTYGLKEGVRRKIMHHDIGSNDIILARCLNIMGTEIDKFDAESYKNILKQINIKINDYHSNIFIYSLILSQYTNNIDRNYKSEVLSNFIMNTDIPFDQFQRNMINVIVNNVHMSKTNNVAKNAKKSSVKFDLNYANIFSSIIKICNLIDGNSLSKPSFFITEKDKYLEINTEIILPKIIFDGICENLKMIALTKKKIKDLN